MSEATKAERVRGIYLVGFSGSGKSTVAKLIGEMLQWPVCDLDELIVQRSGLTIPMIFQREGEPGFRLREADALQAAATADPFVVATGGGTVVRPENRIFMSSKGWIICLEAQPETLLARIQQQLKTSDPKTVRPMLDATDPLAHIRALKHSRQSEYRLADWTVQTDRLTAEQVAAEVIRATDMLARADKPPGF